MQREEVGYLTAGICSSPCASKNVPTLESPVKPGCPLASSSLPSAARGCALPSPNNIKPFGACAVPLQGLGQEGTLSWSGYHRPAPLPHRRSISSPRSRFGWAAMRTLGFLAELDRAGLVLDRLEKWGVRIFPPRQKTIFKDKVAKNKLGIYSSEYCCLIFYLFSTYCAVSASQTNTEVKVFTFKCIKDLPVMTNKQ